jgi:alkaline phosphatase
LIFKRIKEKVEMKLLPKIFVITLTIAVATLGLNGIVLAEHFKGRKAKNIIFMVPDGQGLSNVTAARIFKNGPDGDPLHQETLQNIGYQRTHSANSTVTDSAAAASAWAVGEKFVNNEISCHAGDNGECINEVPTILELAAAKGKATGLVATSQISHATPAAFGAHTVSRYCGTEIARQYLADTKVDIIFGGGVYGTRKGKGCDAYAESFAAVTFNEKDRDDGVTSTQYVLDVSDANGYVYVSDKAGINNAAANGSKKILGMFQQNGLAGGKSVEKFRVDPAAGYPDDEPTLAEMTAAALDILEEDNDGLFLMVEGSQIDWEDHANDVKGQIAESLGFDAAVKVVLDWVNARPSRKNETLIIIVADHDCAGFGINGPYGTLSQAGDIVEDGWTGGSHTAVDTIVYSQGPGSYLLNAALDNTDLYYVMKRAMR